MSNSNTSGTYLKTFFKEKALDEHRILEVLAPFGTPNFIPVGCVVENILIAPENEQKEIATIIRNIDFNNGDVYHFLRHLAKAIAFDF